MRNPRCLLYGALAPLLWLCLGAVGRADSPPPVRPRLAVLVIFDQMRADYLTRWDRLFGKDGFHRLEGEGTWFQNCHYPYAVTVTAAGHASLATGCSPDEHGLVANNWYDRRAAQAVYCVDSDRHERVPPRPRTTSQDRAKRKKSEGISPERLLVPTLADALKKATDGKGRVVSLSLKDRSAVLLGGQRPDACYWLDEGTGEFVTSTFYRQRLHSWVETFNRSSFVNHWQGEEWSHLRPQLDYVRYSGPDDVRGEGTGALQGRTFPHPFATTEKPPAVYYGAVYTSPQGNDLLLALAEKALAQEKLGSHDVPDLLCLSFSSNDAVGHVWGPDSQEVMDTTLRSDLIVEKLLACLDAHVGKGKYVIAVTADHGVCPLPEVSRAAGRPAGRLSPALLDSRASDMLSEHFQLSPEGPPVHWIEYAEDPWIYLNHSYLRGRGCKPAEVEEVLAGWLRKQEGIAAVYTRSRLEGGAFQDDPVGQMVRRSFYAERSGDVMVVVKPYYLITSRQNGTTHGTPHEYDTHVPLLVAGPGMAQGVRTDRITPQAATVILAHALGIAPPRCARAPLPSGLFSPPSP